MDQRRFVNVRKLVPVVLSLVLAAAGSLRADDVVNTASVSFVGTAGPVTLPTNVVRARKLDPVAESGTLFVQKTASRAVVEIGEFVDFTVRVRNVSTFTLNDVAVDDDLPFGFAFEPNSARLNGARLPDPPGERGPRLTFTLGAIEAGRTVELTYRTRVGVDAFHGDGINRAQARTLSGPPATSNVGTVAGRAARRRLQ